ncbi:MAG: BMP family ABC transporter substrate-binding protein [Sutterella sp.]|nr:BMP family ABC transporter substrate-binding protein [Sutterella sp.]
MNKRTAFKLCIAGAAAVMLAACGKDEPKPAPAAKDVKTAAQPAAAAKEPMKVAFVYVSPANEEGWSSQHDIARQYVEKKFGDKIKVTWIENVPENADAERVIRDLAQQGNKMIFATSFGYMNGVMKVAKEFPNVYFEHATGYKTDKNVKNYTARFYEARYLAGKLAGATTKSNVLGYVAALPIPEVFQGINAYTLGAKSVNPNIQVRVVWTSAWYDPGKEADATKSLIGQGADVITHHTNSTAVASTCEEAKVPVISYHSAMHKAAPKMLKAGVVHRWEEYYSSEIQAVLDGKWNNTPVWGGANVHMIELADMTADAPKAVADDIKAVYAKMEKGEFNPFTGPIVSNEGKEMIAKGKVASDADLQSMMYYVDGVASKVPAQK